MIKVYTAKDINEAQIIKGLLASYGIECYVAGQYLQGGVGELAAMDYASLHVAEDKADEARGLLLRYERDELVQAPD